MPLLDWAAPRTPQAETLNAVITRTAPARERLVRGAGNVAGAPFRLAGRGLLAGGGLTVRAAGSLGAFTGKALIGAGARAPLATGLGLASLGMIPRSGQAAVSPARTQAAQAMHREAANFMKVTHVMDVVSPESVDSYLKTRAVFSKTAAVGMTPRISTWEGLINAAVNAGKKSAQKDRSINILGGRHDLRDLLLAGLLLGGGATAAGLAGTAVAQGAGKGSEMVHRMGRNRHFSGMMKADPELKGYSKPEVRRIFNVIHRASPYVSKEPLLAANTVKSILDTPRATHGSKTPLVSAEAVKRVLELEAGRQGTRYPFMREAREVQSGAGNVKPTDIIG